MTGLQRRIAVAAIICGILNVTLIDGVNLLRGTKTVEAADKNRQKERRAQDILTVPPIANNTTTSGNVTRRPTFQPIMLISPIQAPTFLPSDAPASAPVIIPAAPLSHAPSLVPSSAPTDTSSQGPSNSPSYIESHGPSLLPTVDSSIGPTVASSLAPTMATSSIPTIMKDASSSVPSSSYSPTEVPSIPPTLSFAPSIAPSSFPSSSHSPSGVSSKSPSSSMSPSTVSSVSPSSSTSPTVSSVSPSVSTSPSLAASGSPSSDDASTVQVVSSGSVSRPLNLNTTDGAYKAPEQPEVTDLSEEEEDKDVVTEPPKPPTPSPTFGVTTSLPVTLPPTSGATTHHPTSVPTSPTMGVTTGKPTLPTTISGQTLYAGVGWDMIPSFAKAAAMTLGHDQTSWDFGGKVFTDSLLWDQLSSEEELAATVLGYDQKSWDAKHIPEEHVNATGTHSSGEKFVDSWTSNEVNSAVTTNTDVGATALDEVNEATTEDTPEQDVSTAVTGEVSVKPDYLTMDWDDLPDLQKKAAVILGYDKFSWDNDEDVPSHSMHWNAMSFDMRQAAKTLGFRQEEWNLAVVKEDKPGGTNTTNYSQTKDTATETVKETTEEATSEAETETEAEAEAEADDTAGNGDDDADDDGGDDDDGGYDDDDKEGAEEEEIEGEQNVNENESAQDEETSSPVDDEKVLSDEVPEKGLTRTKNKIEELKKELSMAKTKMRVQEKNLKAYSQILKALQGLDPDTKLGSVANLIELGRKVPRKKGRPRVQNDAPADSKPRPTKKKKNAVPAIEKETKRTFRNDASDSDKTDEKKVGTGSAAITRTSSWRQSGGGAEGVRFATRREGTIFGVGVP